MIGNGAWESPSIVPKGETVRRPATAIAISIFGLVLPTLAASLQGGEVVVTDDPAYQSQSPPDYSAACLPAPCAPAPRLWVRADYLMWWTKGMSVPPLVTTSPENTLRPQAGVLGEPGTTVLLGDERLLDDMRWGGRLQVGGWLDRCQCLGIEGEWFALGDEDARFVAESGGDPILARPIFNVLLDRQDAQLVAFPGVVAGTVAVDSYSEFNSAGVRLLRNVRDCGGSRLDLLAGYRYLRLEENLGISENLISTNPFAPGTFEIRDEFDTENQFHGGDIGLLWKTRGCRWSLDVLGKVALGYTEQTVLIDGTTGENPGGVLALRSNMGLHERDEFAVVPEVGVTLGYQLTRNVKATLGYTFLYWSNVVRPGEQIDLAVNPNLFPPVNGPVAGDERPGFAFQETGYWAQGLNFGVECAW